ncbi:MAG: 3-dehydroquinate synthase [Candidatus Omnitrophota bacterium]
MQSVKVNLKNRGYNIIIGSNISKRLPAILKKLKIGNCAYIITNARIKNKCALAIRHALEKGGFSLKFQLIPDSEKSKSIVTAAALLKGLSDYDKKRKIFILAFGGGVVGDLTGFVASIYKRGIPYAQVPTTLLAQVDSAIGGKTAVDLKEGKNLAGAFYQPRLVFTDTAFLKSLDKRQVRAGLAEVIKYGIIKDPRLFYFLEKNYQEVFKSKPAALEYIVKRCSLIKARIVERDEKEEKGLRTILNFGHTLGHAIEAAGNYLNYNHGEAVALGMLCACSISRQLNLSGENLLPRIEKLIIACGLPTKIRGLRLAAIIKAQYRDKKFNGSKNKFVLVKKLGQAKIVNNIPLAIIQQAIKERLA